MSIALDSPAVLARFDAVCNLVAAANNGITMVQLGKAHALARELECDAADTERLKKLAIELGLDEPHLSTPNIS